MRNSIKKAVYPIVIGYFLTQAALADWQLTDAQKREIAARPDMPQAEAREVVAMMREFHGTLAYRAAVIQKMLAEANYFADRLKLPTPHPIRVADIDYSWTSLPWFSALRKHYPGSRKAWWSFGVLPDTIYTTNIFNASIPREARFRSLKIGLTGTLGTTNFAFWFNEGRLREVMRLRAPYVERYALDLDPLVGQPSLIDTNGAYQLATQWLAAVDVDMAALNKQKWVVHQLRYLPRGAANAVVLPLFYVDFNYTLNPRKPPVSVEVLGTTKELQDLQINDLSFSRRPLLFITNALDLLRTPNPPLKKLENLSNLQTNSASP